MNEDSKTLVQDMWQSQPVEVTKMSAEQVRDRVRKLNKKIRRRNLVGGFAAMAVLLWAAFAFSVAPNSLQHIGSALTVVGAGYMMYQLLSAKSRSRDVHTSQADTSLAFYRSELQRQRNFHQGWWLWSRALIFAPGPLLFYVGLTQSTPSLARFIWIQMFLFVTILVAAIPLNWMVARKYQRELDALASGNV